MKEKDDNFRQWLLENADDPSMDSYLESLIEDSADKDEERLLDEAWDDFVVKTGIRKKIDFRAIYNRYSKVAAAVLIPFVAATAILVYRLSLPEVQWVEDGTGYAQTKSVQLSDGTTVKLSSCSKIYYPEHFTGKERRIFLSGEAFLDVAKDAKHKFIVSAGDMEVAVHGTRFNVNSFASDAEDEVALVEGSVEVRFKDGDGNIFLKPGEMIKYDKISRTAERRKFAVNYYEEVMSSDGIQFVNDRLCDIASDLSRRFNIPIIIEDKSVAQERYYATFINNESVDRILESLNTQDHLRIEHDGNSIRIYKN